MVVQRPTYRISVDTRPAWLLFHAVLSTPLESRTCSERTRWKTLRDPSRQDPLDGSCNWNSFPRVHDAIVAVVISGSRRTEPKDWDESNILACHTSGDSGLMSKVRWCTRAGSWNRIRSADRLTPHSSPGGQNPEPVNRKHHQTP